MSIDSIVDSFTNASVELENLCANQIGRPWYTSVEDYYTKESADIRNDYEAQEVLRQTLLDIMAASADALITMERKIGTGRVIRMAAINDVDHRVAMELLNY